MLFLLLQFELFWDWTIFYEKKLVDAGDLPLAGGLQPTHQPTHVTFRKDSKKGKGYG